MSTTVQPKETIRPVYLTSYRDDWIASRRALRSIPAAASNRTLQVARALKRLGLRPVLVSTGQHCFLRATGRLYPTELRSAMGIAPVIYTATIGIPILTYFYSFVPLALTIVGLLRRQPAKDRLLIVYNFAPQVVVASLIARVLFGTTVVMEIEDISRITMKHVTHPLATGIVRQAICAVGFSVMLRICSGTLLAARSFRKHVPERIPSLHLKPCVWDDEFQRTPPCIGSDGGLVRLLYASSVDEEHGIRLLADAVAILEGNSDPPSFELHICGAGPDLLWMQKRSQAFVKHRIYVHGFVSAKRYRSILEASDVALSLQRATGLTGERQFPSKIAEFMSEGKVVVTTVFGDIDDIPSSTISKLHKETAPELAELLWRLCQSRALLSKISLAAADYARSNFAVGTGARHLGGFLRDIGYVRLAAVSPQVVGGPEGERGAAC